MDTFKHGIILSQRSDISISILLKDNILLLETKNAISNHTNQSITNSGIGLKNARERLLLLYPNKHNLEIHNSDSFFNVKLQIETK